MSPWADVEVGAAEIGPSYVFSWKPNPNVFAVDGWDPDAIERQIGHVVDVCAEVGCPLEITMKDISTVRHRPQRLWEWADIAMRSVQRERPGGR